MMNFDELNIRQAAKLYLELRSAIEDKKAELSVLHKQYDKLRFGVMPDRMEDEGYETLRIKDVGTVVLTDDVAASFSVELPTKEHGYTWLETQGHGDIVVRYVHPSTLKAFVKEQMKNGHVLPDDVFTVRPFVRASVRQS